MKRGVAINIIVIIVLLIPIGATLGLAAASEQAARAAGCDTSATPFSPQAECSSYYSGVFLGALASMFTLPLSAGLLGLYFLGLLIAWGVSFSRGRAGGHAASPTLTGMGLSSLALLGLAALALGVTWAVSYYRSSVVSACRALPQAGQVRGPRTNGSLALGVRLPYPEGRPEQYVVQTLTDQGALLQTIKAIPASKSPVWSPDGTRLAFAAQSKASQLWGLYLADAQGVISGPLIEGPSEMRPTAWSPDGQKLLFQRAREDNNNPNIELYTVNLDGGSLTALTDSEGYDGEGRFSPDGKTIVFTSKRNGASDIYVMNADGSNPRPLTHGNQDDAYPDWSPDGQWIAFASTRLEQSVYQVYLMAPDGSNQCRLTQNAENALQPRWSPDGQWIVFLDWRRDTVHRIQPDGSGQADIPIEAGNRPLTVDWGVAPDLLAEQRLMWFARQKGG